MYVEISALSQLTLIELYQLLIDRAPNDETVICEIAERGLLAESLLAPFVAGLPLRTLLEAAARCREGAACPGAATPALEVTARELRRVHLLAIEAELERRQAASSAERSGGRVRPDRAALLDRVQKVLHAAARADGSNDAAYTREIATICQREKPRSVPGATRVAAVLFALNAGYSPNAGAAPRDDAWLGSGIALRLLAGVSPYEGDRTLNVEPETVSAALRGYELMFDARRDGGAEAQSWLLDLDGPAVAVLLEQGAIASREWARRHYPQSDQALYELVGARHR